VTRSTHVPILVFIGLSVLDLGLMYATDRQTDARRQTDVIQTDVRQHRRFMPPPIREERERERERERESQTVTA